jgi:4-carboxymuconolactone decarboxylase
MPRVPALSRTDLPEGKRYIYDKIASSRGKVIGPFSVLLHSPEIAQRIAHLGAYVRFESSLPKCVRELAILVTAREWNCQFEWTSHVPMAREAGVREEAIRSIRDRMAPEGLDDDESAVVCYVVEAIRERRVSDETFRAARDRLGNQGVIDLTATMGYYAMVAGVINTFEVELAPGNTPLLPL